VLVATARYLCETVLAPQLDAGTHRHATLALARCYEFVTNRMR
jgi:hypothetical protein